MIGGNIALIGQGGGVAPAAAGGGPTALVASDWGGAVDYTDGGIWTNPQGQLARLGVVAGSSGCPTSQMLEQTFTSADGLDDGWTSLDIDIGYTPAFGEWITWRFYYRFPCPDAYNLDALSHGICWNGGGNGENPWLHLRPYPDTSYGQSAGEYQLEFQYNDTVGNTFSAYDNGIFLPKTTWVRMEMGFMQVNATVMNARFRAWNGETGAVLIDDDDFVEDSGGGGDGVTRLVDRSLTGHGDVRARFRTMAGWNSGFESQSQGNGTWCEAAAVCAVSGNGVGAYPITGE